MTKNDILNLIFLLEASEETILDWWSKTTDDEHKYATELLDTYSFILNEEKLNKTEWFESQNILGKIMYEL